MKDKFKKRESFIHDSAKKVLVEDLCGRELDKNGYSPAYKYKQKEGSVGDCDVAYEFQLEKEFYLNGVLSFITDILIKRDDMGDYWFIEIHNTHKITEDKKNRIKEWCDVNSVTYSLFEIPVNDIMKIDKFNHMSYIKYKTHNVWKFIPNFLDDYLIDTNE